MPGKGSIKRDYFEWTERQWRTPDGRLVPYKTADITELFWDVIPFTLKYVDPLLSVGVVKWPTKYTFKLRWKVIFEYGLKSIAPKHIYWTIEDLGSLNYIEYHTKLDQFLELYRRKMDLFLIPPILEENLSQQTRREQILELYDESVSHKYQYYQDWDCDFSGWGEEPF